MVGESQEMNFNLDQLSPVYTSKVPCVGNVYCARGGKKGSTRFWIVVAIRGDSTYLLGINNDGEICSSQSYYTSAVGRMPLIGYCPDVDCMEFSIVPVPN